MKRELGLDAIAHISQHASQMEAFELLRKHNLFSNEMPLLALRR